MKRPKKTIQVYYEDWQRFKQQALDEEKSIADILEKYDPRDTRT